MRVCPRLKGMGCREEEGRKGGEEGERERERRSSSTCVAGAEKAEVAVHEGALGAEGMGPVHCHPLHRQERRSEGGEGKGKGKGKGKGRGRRGRGRGGRGVRGTS